MSRAVIQNEELLIVVDPGSLDWVTFYPNRKWWLFGAILDWTFSYKEGGVHTIWIMQTKADCKLLFDQMIAGVPR